MTRPLRSSTNQSVAIVGAGPGGLSTAMLLAASGVPVTIYDAQPTVGGRTARITQHAPGVGDFHFDTGPTFFLMPYVLDEIFAAAGRKISDYVELTRLDPMYRLLLGRDDGAPLPIDCTQDIAEMARRLAVISPSDAENFPKFIAENRKKLEVFTPVLRKPFRTFTDLLDPQFFKAGPYLKPTKSVNDYLSGFFKDPRTRLAMSFQTKYLGMSPFKCPSLFSILPLIEYEYGVWHPKGGCNALVHAMATACAEMGVKIHCSSPVSQIAFEGRRAVGVQIAGSSEVRRHDHVLLNADASWAIKNLIPASLRQGWGAKGMWSDAKLDSMSYSCSTYMLYLGLSKPVDLPHHTIFIAADYQKNIAEIAGEHEGKLSDDPSIYICNPSAIDPTLAPKGCSALYVLVPTPNTRASIDWASSAPALRARTLKRIAAIIGRDITPEILVERQITPDDWQAANINVGATFNLAHALGQMLHRRPQHELVGVENVWLAGGGTHPGSGLPVIFLSAQIAGRKLCERLNVPYAGAAAPAVEPKPFAAASA